MHKRTTGHLQSLFWALVVLVITGLSIGELSWTLVVGLLSYLCWTSYQSVRLHKWLYQINSEQGIPESYGLWGDLFEGLHQIQYQDKLNQDRLKSLVARVQMSTNALKEAVVMTNDQGEMDWWNDAACTLLGFQRETDRGQLVTNLVRDPSFKYYFDSKDYQAPLELSSPINNNVMLRFNITLFGKADRLVFAQDITRIHRLEQMRRDFVSNVSHDMRTPLTVIRGYIETLQDSEALPKKWHRPLQSMEEQTKRMEILIRDLLVLAKYETEDISGKSEAVDVEAMLKMIHKDAQVFSGEKHHRIDLLFESDPAFRFLGDERQLYSALSNIVYNAVKYTPVNGRISLHWWQDKSGVHFSVEDTGVGFDAVHIPHLTERFYRTDPSRDNTNGGSGLGLAIVKHVLLNHNGSLEIYSKEGEGSEFICHFPLTAVTSAQ
jgi:two-component system phosphate regulon sensor histidine kinase PhoR